jgi:Family of unknown function (DUF5320)
MPGRNQTGPNGAGAMTGRKMGACSGVNGQGAGLGMGRGFGAGRGMGRGFGAGAGRGMGLGRQAGAIEVSPEQQKAQLKSDIEILRDELTAAEARLGNLD